ncbi:MAG TPA: DNA methyltransferase [Synechococcus sp. UBA8638]|nr:DNA methyltransferase [Synechococcus sp. UBA8638]
MANNPGSPLPTPAAPSPSVLERSGIAQEFDRSALPAVNVASVPQRSPLRYPGGKTWLIPHIRKWLSGPPTPLLMEPFAGGGVVSLTAVMEGRAARALMVDLDRDVAAFWRTALDHSEDLIARILAFSPERDGVEQLARQAPQSVVDHGFRTLVLNRTRRGGVLAPGASLTRHGENGGGLCSRWYPDTLAKRLRDIAHHADQLLFYEGDGVGILDTFAEYPGTRFFVDPPYTAAGGKRAGSRLYRHNTVDHERIFHGLARSHADFLMTYDYSSQVVELIRQHHFHAVVVDMKNGHHARIPELVITRDSLFS